MTFISKSYPPLLICVFFYLLISVLIGFLATMRIKNKSDFINAGRKLPTIFISAMVFTTWFGSEAILGVPATFIKEGLSGIIKDPFGAFFCLFIVGIILAKRWYRLNVVTLANIYQKRFGETVEVIITICIVISYFGWVAAQMFALGFVINLLSLGNISIANGIIIGASVILIYTITGGMLAIAFNDFIQLFIIIVSLLYILYVLSGLAGGLGHIAVSAYHEKMFVFIKNYNSKSVIHFFGALFTLMIGSIPQQDIFQRVVSSKNENTAQRGMIFGALLYLVFCLVPIFLVFAAKLINPEGVHTWISQDSQRILPSLILSNTSLFIQVIFFGALLSAIMSTASGTLMAPSVTITENIIKKIYPQLSDSQYILVLRSIILLTGLVITIFALNSNSSIYEMVGNAYKITLVTSAAPLFAAMFWKRATTIGALISIFLGFFIWIIGELLNISEPQLFGFIASVIGVIIGSYLSPKQSDEVIFSVINYNPKN